MRQILILFFILPGILSHSQTYIPGYQRSVAGEELYYHSPQPDAKVSLLVRSEDSARYIEWETGGTLQGFKPLEGVTLLLLAGIDVNPDDPRCWKLLVNDRHLFTICSPKDTTIKMLEWAGPGGAKMWFRVSEVDKYGDLMGYLFIHLPAAFVEPGKPIRLKVTGETAGSRTWFMVFKYVATSHVSLIADNAVERTADGNMQLLRTTVVHYGEPTDASITVGHRQFSRHIAFGYQSLGIPVPEIKNDTVIPVKVTTASKVICDTVFTLRPVQPRTIYLLHHSHNDIGYTHVQDEVEQMQWRNLQDAIKTARASQDYPEGARFRWNVEVMWAIDSYLEQATPEEKTDFAEAVRKGWIELDGLFANELTSLCESEELLWLMESARRISRECGVPLRSAMITDIPGWTWGLVPALALSGVKYLSLGTNSGHRIGGTIKEWGDRPFYWVSPSGEEKVLCWIHQKGYSYFHTGLDYKKIKKRLQEDMILDYMNQLAAEEYPYEMVMLRYTIGSDNGPVDDNLPDEVKAWNERYITPRIIISTVGEAFSQFEAKYGKELPEVSGDFTGFWEDGAYSTTRETAMNRASAVRLNQAQALRTIMGAGNYMQEAFREAWKYILLFDEHTWGSWNSISEPESDFTVSQWANKAHYATKAHDLSSRLFTESMPEVTMEMFPLAAFEVINTCSWTRDGLVTVPIDVLPPNPVILDAEGKSLPVQLLSDGQLAFLATGVPPMGTKMYRAEEGRTLFHLPDEGAPVPMLSNRDFSLQIDETTGAIRDLLWKANNTNLADVSRWSGLNEFLYVAGRWPEHPQAIDRARIMPGENGPVINSLRIISKPPGCRYMETEVELVSGLGQIFINNIIDKEKIYEPEAIHFAFPFRIDGGKMRYDLALGQCEVEKDQIKGFNRNFITMENWIDISNDQYGVTVACPDAPLFEVGKLTMDEIVTGWVEAIEPSQTFFSYVMNNYWETNYAAAQEGRTSISYIIRPHAGFDPVEAERFGIESRYPLLVIPADVSSKSGSTPSKASGPADGMFGDLIVISQKPAGMPGEVLFCLYNPASVEVIINLEEKGKSFYLSDTDGLQKKSEVRQVSFPAKAIRFILVEQKKKR